MYTQRIAILLWTVLILSSCNTRKNKDHLLNTEPLALKNTIASILPEEALELASLANDFTKSIAQHFVVAGKRITVITAKGGLKVTVDAAALEKEDGSVVDGKIKVSIVELRNTADFFKANTATTSDGKLLASGGSYFIGMESGGQKLRLKSGKTITVDFPLLKKEGMELFYGERSENDDMNWKKADIDLERQYESIGFDDTEAYRSQPVNVATSLEEMLPAKVYRSLEEQVYYYNKKMTIQQLVDTVNKNSPKVYLQTISFWPKNMLPDQRRDTNFLIRNYGPMKQYILRSYKNQEKDENAIKKVQDAVEENFRPKQTIAQQLKTYYAPAAVANLGWINCDRFYQNKEQTETDLDLPITLHNSRIEYFVIFKSFNGLLRGSINFNEQEKPALQNLPIGESVTIIAFAKSKGMIYQAKEDFVITRNKKLPLDFKSISTEEMNKLFGKNVRI